MGSNSAKAKTLGMPHGTAAHRLRKSIMFKYVTMAGDNYCFKCGSEIESVDDLSIEHKIPWEGVSADLFFDLDNVAFSHTRCNRPDRTFSGPRKDWSVTQKRCSSCGEVKHMDDFHLCRSRSDGRQTSCKSCK